MGGYEIVALKNHTGKVPGYTGKVPVCILILMGPYGKGPKVMLRMTNDMTNNTVIKTLPHDSGSTHSGAVSASPARRQDQLELFDPAEITRPDVNIGRAAGRIFASPYSRGLYDPKVFEWEIDQGDEKARASLTVTPLKGKKRPTTTTLKVYLALTQLWEKSGCPRSGEVNFSARQLAHVLKWRWSGKNSAARIQEQLTILKGTQIDWLRSYTRGTRVETRVSEMNIISDREYIERRDMTRVEMFSSHQMVILNPRIVENMLAGNTKPINYEAFVAIGDETSANLYALLDTYLSGKRHWARRALPLIRDELFLDGKRYEQRFARHERLKRLTRDLDGVELSSGRLELQIKETADGKDWKLVARKVPRITRKRRMPPRPANRPDDIPHIVMALQEGFANAFGRRLPESSVKTLALLAHWYREDMLHHALSVVKTDLRGRIRTSPARAFVWQVHVMAHECGLPWIRDCGDNCQAREQAQAHRGR